MPKKTRNEEGASPRLIVTVSGGVVDVLYKPKGIAINLFDYDVDGADDDELAQDPDGQRCVVREWPASELIVGAKHWPLVKNARRSVVTALSRKWTCANCQRVTRCSYETLAEVGAPYCPACDREMQLT